MTKHAPVIAVSRLRMGTDGKGITTLVGFHGCPLRCKWCINPASFAENTRCQMLTARMLYERVKVDELYFIATGGGVTFGGGEPLLQAEFIREFRGLCGEEWHLCAETSLAVPEENIDIVSECIDRFYVDCKDLNTQIYRKYTGADNALMLRNLERLLKLVGAERITVRLPLIPEFNTEADRAASKERLMSVGIGDFDLFTYRKGKN